MAIRVAHIGTGNVGGLALSELIANPAFELTGLVVSTDEKVGKDAGELAGLDVTTGITATKDLDAVWPPNPSAPSTARWATTGCRRRWRTCARSWPPGSTWSARRPGVLQFPWQVMPDKYIEPLEDAGRAGQFEHLHQRCRSGLHHRPDSAGLRQHLSEHPAGALHGDRRLRHLRRRDRDVRRHGLRSTARRGADAVPARRPEHRVGLRDPAAGGRAEHQHRLDRARATSASPRRRRSTSPPATSPRAGSRPCASRSRAWSATIPSSSSSTSPGCGATCVRSGPSPPSPAGPTASRSPVSRPMPSTSARPAQGRPQPRRHRRRGRAHRQRHPGGDRRAAGHPDHAEPSAGLRGRAVLRAVGGPRSAGRASA